MFTAIKNFFENLKTNRILKYTQKRFAERYDAEQLKELYGEFNKSARKILADVLLPYINEQKHTYRGAKEIRVRISVWEDEKYKITSQYDSQFHEYKYPNSELDCHGVWQEAIKLAQKYGLKGRCDEDDYGIDYYFEWKKVA